MINIVLVIVTELQQFKCNEYGRPTKWCSIKQLTNILRSWLKLTFREYQTSLVSNYGAIHSP